MSSAHRLFQVFGVELEYMIVDAETLDVLPIADRLIAAARGDAEPGEGDYDDGPISWSNELALHVIEFKTTRPVRTLVGLADEFLRSIEKANTLLADPKVTGGKPAGGRLMPTAMHPWMDPHREKVLWPHDYGEVYAAFDRIFDCRGHGWANLQSAHLNLPFDGDEEFGRLHAAIRLILPILPALAASSPIMDSRVTGLIDTRLDVYRGNARRVPSVSGKVIPEPAYTRADYEHDILGKIYRDLAPHDPEGLLRHEWANARGAIARFDRSAIEVRVLDVQESPRADVAVVALTSALAKALAGARWKPVVWQMGRPVEQLFEVLIGCIREGQRHLITDADYLSAFGVTEPAMTARQLWQILVDELLGDGLLDRSFEPALRTILDRGTLSRRILDTLGLEAVAFPLTETVSREKLAPVYRRLCDALPGPLSKASAGGEELGSRLRALV